MLFHIGNYQNFLYLIGSVFVPLFGVLVVDYFVLHGDRRWDVAEHARVALADADPVGRRILRVPADQPRRDPALGRLLGTQSPRDIGFTAQSWMSASLLSFVAAGLLTLIVRVPARRGGARAS